MLSARTKLTQRVNARRQQLLAWRHLMRASVVAQAQAQIKMAEMLGNASIAVVTFAVLLALEQDASLTRGAHLAIAIVVGLLSAIPASIARDVWIDRALGRAFATMSPQSFANASASFAPVVPFSPPAHDKAAKVSKPKLSETDRDAVDFDDFEAPADGSHPDADAEDFDDAA